MTNDDYIKENLSKAGQASLLPQYFNSSCMYERFLNATSDNEDEIDRSENVRGQVKLTDSDEIKYENLNYFIDKKSDLEDEFFEELTKQISEERASEFCKIISENWYDGRAQRNSEPVKKLFASIKNYLLEYRKVKSEDGIMVFNQIEDDYEPNFDDDEIETILSINRQMFDGHIHKWIEGHPKHLEMGSGDIYCRRGIFLENKIMTKEFLEWNYINSYSLAFSVTEKFAQMSPNDTPAILNTNLANIRERTLFFSPFIKNMPIDQFELGIIPHWWTMRIIKQGTHGGIEEYIID